MNFPANQKVIRVFLHRKLNVGVVAIPVIKKGVWSVGLSFSDEIIYVAVVKKVVFWVVTTSPSSLHIKMLAKVGERGLPMLQPSTCL